MKNTVLFKLDNFKLLLSFIAFFLMLPCVGQSLRNDVFKQKYENNYVLVISSYTYEQEWSTHIAKGLQHAIEERDSTVLVKVDYVGADIRNTFLATRYGMQSVFYNNSARPGLIVFIGDEAWMTYRVMSLRGWETIPVILCGVSEMIMKDYPRFFKDRVIADSLLIPVAGSSEQVRFTSVIRQENARPTIELIKRLLPDMNKLLFVSERNYLDMRIEKDIRSVLNKSYPQVRLNVIYDNGFNTDSICNGLRSPLRDEVLLVNNWYEKLQRRRTEDKEIDNLFRYDIKMPAFSFVDKNPKDSLLIGGCFPSTDTYTTDVTNLVFRVLNGENPASIPDVYTDNSIILNKSALQYLNIRKYMDRVPDAIYTNIPPSFFIRNQRLILGGTLLLIIIFMCSRISLKKRRYRAELRKSLDRYRTLYDEYLIVYNTMPIGLLLFDSNGRLIRINPEAEGYCKLAQLSEKDLNNLFQTDFLTEEMKACIQKKKIVNEKLEFKELGNNGESLSHHFRLIVRTIENSMQRNSAGEILMIMIDISEIQRERIERENMNYIFEFAMAQSRLGVAEYNLLDGKGYATEAWYKNLKRDSLTEFTDVCEYIVAEDRLKINEFIDEAKNGESVSFANSVRIEYDGEVHWLRYVIKVIEYAPKRNIIKLAELVLNIDDQKQREKELALAMKKARESEILKNAFVVNMGHEIRAPLNSIVGFSDLLCECDDLEQRQALIPHIEENNEILLQLIGDIIDLSKIESGTIEFAFVESDLRELLNDITFMVKSRIDPAKIEVINETKGSAHFVVIDKVRIKQIIANFAANAVRFTREGYIKIGYEVEDNQLYFYIEDSGLGISKEKQQAIARSLARPDKSSRGDGLRLSIAKSIISRMDGEIGFKSQEGKGTIFWCKIPVRVIDKMVNTIEIRPIDLDYMSGLNSDGFSILVAEDNESNFLLMEYALGKQYKLIHAWNGKEAVEMFAKYSPSIILMDIKMPVMNGYEATAEIRKLSESVPIIAVTAHAFSQDEERILHSGFNGYLPKPIQSDKLLALISAWAEKLAK